MIPYKCPVCEGRGRVPYDFYEPYLRGRTTSISDILCRSCKDGIIYMQHEVQLPTELIKLEQ